MKKRHKTKDTQFERNLNGFVNDVRLETLGWHISDIAKATGLAASTCSNFVTGKTRSPHYRTVYRIAKALNLHIDLTKQQVRLKVFRAS